MKSKRLHLKLGVALLLSMGNPFAVFPQTETAERILMRYVDDYQKDVALTKDALFGIKVDTVFWHVKAKAKTKSGAASVQLFKGEPTTPTYYFKRIWLHWKRSTRVSLMPLRHPQKLFPRMLPLLMWIP
ncbi:hypothetical protein L0P88_08335 [Muricauda sp. SCSIO 64092]|uniref:hypothetical protein n=1 Tax=Allomuricauda sp. SCSIO 64092 TaxID=2908842 RepID=UPI001FF486A9|nr:hypothetical protein [Muricauda sp. SCSIO 64092]UOY08548.1 hypothetical protein L0P88_08335 [Muricauda sp. SCSIO 64092]